MLHAHWAEIVDQKNEPLTPITDENVVCHIPISIGRPYYENPVVLRDIVDAAKRVFSKCKIVVHIADTLQAITLRLIVPQSVEKEAVASRQAIDEKWEDLSAEKKEPLLDKAAYSLAKQHGQKWRADNLKLFEDLNPSIDHWEYWTSQPEFSTYLSSIENCYKQKEEFRDAVNVAAFNFMGVLNTELRKGRIPPLSPVKAAIANIDYIEQETAVTKMWQNSPVMKGCSRFIVIYPSNTIENQFIADCLNNLDMKVESHDSLLQTIAPRPEIFGISFYCSKDDNPISNIDLYKVPRKRTISKHIAATRSLPLSAETDVSGKNAVTRRSPIDECKQSFQASQPSIQSASSPVSSSFFNSGMQNEKCDITPINLESSFGK